MVIRKKQIAPIYGGIAALALIIFTFILYKQGVAAYLGETAYLGYAMLIGLAAAAAMALKKANDGYLDFREALKAAFTVFVIALGAQTLFTWLLMNYLDVHFREDVTKAVLQRTEEMVRKMGLTGDQVETAMTDERSKNQFSFGRMLTGLAFTYIVHFIIALLIAAIVKRKRPEGNSTL